MSNTRNNDNTDACRSRGDTATISPAAQAHAMPRGPQPGDGAYLPGQNYSCSYAPAHAAPAVITSTRQTFE